LWRGFPVRSPTASVSWARRSRTATSAACIAVSVGDDGTNFTRCQLSILPPTCTICLSMYLSNYICLLRRPSKGGWAGFFISSRPQSSMRLFYAPWRCDAQSASAPLSSLARTWSAAARTHSDQPLRPSVPCLRLATRESSLKICNIPWSPCEARCASGHFEHASRDVVPRARLFATCFSSVWVGDYYRPWQPAFAGCRAAVGPS
jgi:hypothetical protein